jgi:hypothetical protein
MTTKDLIIQELEQLPEPDLEQVLRTIRALKKDKSANLDEQIWQAYLESEQENEEVYRRLANS